MEGELSESRADNKRLAKEVAELKAQLAFGAKAAASVAGGGGSGSVSGGGVRGGDGGSGVDAEAGPYLTSIPSFQLLNLRAP